MDIEEGTVKTDRHTSGYLACGPSSGPRVYFVHGWPELSLSWRHQLYALGNVGFRAIAPDMRGYGKSSVYHSHGDYAQTEIVKDMLELHEATGNGKAVWVGHDWGSPVVWNMALHHPEVVHGVASLCVPMGFEEGVEALIPHVNRDIYPEAEYPKGQWDYQYFYQESFEVAQNEMEVDPYRLVKALFRKGSPEGVGKPAGTAVTRKNGGWFGKDGPPDLPIDLDVVSAEDAKTFAAALSRNGFFGANSWYMNHDKNYAYSQELSGDKKLNMPVLFFHGEYDFVCQTVNSTLAEPMRENCPNLVEIFIKSGHWMAQEKPMEVNAGLMKWLAGTADYWVN